MSDLLLQWEIVFGVTYEHRVKYKMGRRNRYSKVSIGDTQEHPLGVYLGKELLYFNVTSTKCHIFLLNW